jgi:hypothetical protein
MDAANHFKESRMTDLHKLNETSIEGDGKAARPLALQRVIA